MTIDGILSLNPGHIDKFDVIMQELKRKQALGFAFSFFRDLGDTLCDVYGYGKMIPKLWERPLRAKELIMREKIRLDVDATLLLRFNGREVVKKIDWERLLKSVEDGDKRTEDEWKRLKRAVEKQKEARMAWIENVVADELA